jgi:archaellum biogenesis protein FlaJ (TadC family)
MWLKIEYYGWYSAAIPRIIQSIISIIELPAFVISAIIGGNPDYPIFFVYYPLLILTFVLVFSGLVGLIRFASKQAHNSRFLQKKQKGGQGSGRNMEQR